jgi:REP element-mobilizing transposase RayT
MAIADHLVFSAYGFWLPNDPRGSFSDFVRSWELLRAGRATQVDTIRSVAHVDAEFPEYNQSLTAYPPVMFDGLQARQIARGFYNAIQESKYAIHACAIMPDHVHIVVARHAHAPKQIVGHLKTRATQAMAEDGRHPLALHLTKDGTVPSPWAQRSWDVYLDTVEDVRRSIAYVEENPGKAGLKRQAWAFVAKFEEPG